MQGLTASSGQSNLLAASPRVQERDGAATLKGHLNVRGILTPTSGGGIRNRKPSKHAPTSRAFGIQGTADGDLVFVPGNMSGLDPSLGLLADRSMGTEQSRSHSDVQGRALAGTSASMLPSVPMTSGSVGPGSVDARERERVIEGAEDDVQLTHMAGVPGLQEMPAGAVVAGVK